MDFRKQVFKIKENYNLSLRETGERFNVPVRTLQRWKARIEPKTQRNKPATKIDMEALRNHVEEFPDAYQYERAAHFNVSPNCILYALRRLKISHKKNVLPSQVGSGKKS